MGAEVVDYAVMPLNGLWWADDTAAFSASNKVHWKWTMMIMPSQWVTPDVLQRALADVSKKGLAAVSRLRLESFTEGRPAQTLHVGPFSQEGSTI